MKKRLVPCPSCKRHVFFDQERCPHCDRIDAGAVGLAIVLAGSLALAACSSTDSATPASADSAAKSAAASASSPPGREMVAVYGPPAVFSQTRIPSAVPSTTPSAVPSSSAKKP